MCIPLLALIFCSAFALCLIVFCRQIVHIYTVCIYAGCCRCHFNYLSAFLWTYFRFSCLHRPLITYNMLLASCLVMFQIFLVFFLARFVIVFFALQIILLHQFELARFRFLRRLCLIFFILITYTHPYPTARLFLPPHSSKWSCLTTVTIPVDLLIFPMLCIRYKIGPPHPIISLFPLFLLLPVTIGPIAPIGINLHPCASTHTTFCQIHQNMMSGEISPAIGPKSGPARPKSAPPLFVFVSPVPPTPQRTHTHPYTPIHTYFHPYTT